MSEPAPTGQWILAMDGTPLGRFKKRFDVSMDRDYRRIQLTAPSNPGLEISDPAWPSPIVHIDIVLVANNAFQILDDHRTFLYCYFRHLWLPLEEKFQCE